MLKKVLFATAALVLIVSTVRAEDGLFDLDAASITDARVEIEEAGLDIDVDGLADQADSEDSEDAVEACFRRFGYRYSYGYRSWGCYRPYISSCYSSYFCYRPVHYYSYRVIRPIYRHYWGCY